MDPISVAVHRGPFVESVHLVHAVAVQDGAVVAEAGDSGFLTSLRSSAKPFQALPLERVAFMFSRLEAREGGGRVVAAMRAHPQLVGGTGQPDTDLMRALPGWIAKGGAEGLFCAAAENGLGVALKSQDGSYRALRPALASFFERLGLELDDGFAHVPVRNSRGEDVGELATRG